MGRSAYALAGLVPTTSEHAGDAAGSQPRPRYTASIVGLPRLLVTALAVPLPASPTEAAGDWMSMAREVSVGGLPIRTVASSVSTSAPAHWVEGGHLTTGRM